MQLWTIVDRATGSVLASSYPTASAGQHPKDAGWAWDAAKHRAVRIDAPPDMAVDTWTGEAWGADASKIEAMLVAEIKAESERRAMQIYTPGRAKMKKYSRKQQEVLDWRGMAGAGAVASVLVTAFNALPAVNRKHKFRFAIADAAMRGDTVADAIARFETGIGGSEDVIANLEAVEQAAVAAIKAAPTAAAKRAAAAAINWNWAP